VNTDAPWPSVDDAQTRVLEIQTKLHRWAGEYANLRFDDLYNLVCDPAFLLVAWHRVRGNRGARSAGVDNQSAYEIEQRRGHEAFLGDLREQLKQRRFVPLPVRERLIPKADGRKRRLGIPTVTDRVVQAAAKLVLEPIFEADFQPCSYGFRPKRRAQDAIAEIHFFTSRKYEWIVEADIEACFDRIDHAALMDRMRQRIGDKRVLALVKAFLKAGILTELGDREATLTGTPQGGVLSPLLANIALTALDEHFATSWQATMSTVMRRRVRRRKGLGCWRLVRFADDCHHGGGHSGQRASTAYRGGGSTGPTGPESVTAEDTRGARQRGLRLPRVSYPQAAQARDGQMAYLHLPLTESTAIRADQGAGADLSINNLDAALADARPGFGNRARLGVLLSTWGFQSLLRQAGHVCVAALHALAAKTPSPCLMATLGMYVHATVADCHQRTGALQRSIDPGHPVSISRYADSHPVATLR
jgi:group II intron reverse transcriptase/maturase